MMTLGQIAQCHKECGNSPNCGCDSTPISCDQLVALCDAAEDAFALRTVSQALVDAAIAKHEADFVAAFHALQILLSCPLKDGNVQNCPDTCIRHSWQGKCSQCSADVTLTMARVHSVGALCAACSPK